MNRRGADRVGPLGSSGVIANWGGSSLIKSIQRGTITFSNPNSGTATIATVDLANAYVSWCGNDVNADVTATGSNSKCGVYLSNSTTVTAQSWGTANTKVLSYEVIEFVPGVVKQIQNVSAFYIPDGSASATLTINSVNLAKTLLVWGGQYTNDANTQEYSGRTYMRAQITNSTTLTASRGIALNFTYLYGSIVEFF